MVRWLRWFANLKLSALEYRVTAVTAYGHLSVVPPARTTFSTDIGDDFLHAGACRSGSTKICAKKWWSRSSASARIRLDLLHDDPDR